MTDTSRDAPEVLRRKVRNLIRVERETRGLTQREAAAAVLWSQSKLVRMESGASPATPADVRTLMIEYGVEYERVAELVAIAQEARRPDEWDNYKQYYSPTSISLFANEQSASLIQKHEASIIPGLLQTEEYARALLKEMGVDPHLIEGKIRGRLLRQEILDIDACPDLDFVIGEATVSRPIGGTEVMLRQVDHLKKMARHKRVTLRLMPFSAGAHPGMGTAFTILTFRDPDLADLVYLESSDRDSIVRDDTEAVQSYIERYAEVRELASAPETLEAELDVIAARRLQEN